MEGRRFRRQHSIGNYIVDFFCFSEKLIVEVDGTSHDDSSSEQNDTKRDAFFHAHGFKIIRINAIDIKNNLAGVLMDIINCFNSE